MATGTHCKQRRGKYGGLRPKLRLNPQQPALPGIFLASVQSVADKLDELKGLRPHTERAHGL